MQKNSQNSGKGSERKPSSILAKGAEAIISLNNNNQVLKNRTKKSYRLKELDTKLRKSRTKSESKIITKLKNIIFVPKIISTNENQIIMQYIDGKKLSEHLENLDYKKIAKQIGETLTKLHNQNIIHGDLTTSNMIYVKNKQEKFNITPTKNISPTNKQSNNKIINNNIKNFKVYLIDFGLGFHSRKIEDKAVDLHLLQQALNAKHFKIAEQCFEIILKNYKSNQYELIIPRIKIIEQRGRYKHK